MKLAYLTNTRIIHLALDSATLCGQKPHGRQIVWDGPSNHSEVRTFTGPASMLSCKRCHYIRKQRHPENSPQFPQ
jgi:hypothetical protein